MMHAPAAERFPAVPAAWYLFGPSRLLRHGPHSRAMLSRRFVAYRKSNGQPVVLDARCAHLGADLGGGGIEGDSIRCPFHGWVFGPDGVCTHATGAAEVPAFARQQAFPCIERHGHLFFFHGAAPTHPLPFFFDEDPEAFVGGRLFAFRAACPWYMLAANGFDMAHMQVVHDRTLAGTPEVDCPAPFARRVRYRTRVTGHSIFDRLLRTFVGGDVDVSITNWAGPMTLVTGKFRRAASSIVIATQPTDDGATWVEVIVLARRRAGLRGRLAPLGLELRRWFTRGFMQDDIDRIGGMLYRPHTFVDGDAMMVEFLNWAAALHQPPSRNGVCHRSVPDLVHAPGSPD
jgi:nitrite reductase/ring-hydroxylating ferredoxin subunit